MKKFFFIVIFATFLSFPISSAETLVEWKWEKAFESVVLISTQSEKVADNTLPVEPFPPLKKDDKSLEPLEPIVPPKFGMGAGFFINEIHVVTNYHVVKGAEVIRIYAFNHPFEITEVKVVGYDAEVDIAVLEILEDVEHDYLEFANETPLIGDTVYALGHGTSQMWSLTTGIISYDSRKNRQTSFVHYLQTDAVINSGNSGGPLLNENGEVVGVNTLIISPDRYYVGYGYVIPVKLAERVVTQILATGQHIKPSIGILMGIIDDKELFYKLKGEGKEHYLEIKEVVDGSPADRFGFLKGDIIVSIDDVYTAVTEQVIQILWNHSPGDELKFKIYRDGEYIELNLILGMSTEKIETLYGKR